MHAMQEGEGEEEESHAGMYNKFKREKTVVQEMKEKKKGIKAMFPMLL